MEAMKIMLVDDEERFLSTTQKLLTKKGIDVVTAASGRFILICVYRARSRLAWQAGASEAGGSVQICVPEVLKQ